MSGCRQHKPPAFPPPPHQIHPPPLTHTKALPPAKHHKQSTHNKTLPLTSCTLSRPLSGPACPAHPAGPKSNLTVQAQSILLPLQIHKDPTKHAHMRFAARSLPTKTVHTEPKPQTPTPDSPPAPCPGRVCGPACPAWETDHHVSRRSAAMQQRQRGQVLSIDGVTGNQRGQTDTASNASACRCCTLSSTPPLCHSQVTASMAPEGPCPLQGC